MIRDSMCGESCWPASTTPPSDPSAKQIWQSRLMGLLHAAGYDSAEPICNYWKSQAPYVCDPVSAPVLMSQQAAITYYQTHYGADAICAPLKENAPFQCTKSTPKTPLEILSLSVANTQLAYGVIGSAFVFLLYKTKKAKKVKGVDETSILARLEELEASNNRLEASNKQLEASVADLKSR